jgi:hypothetical protein
MCWTMDYTIALYVLNDEIFNYTVRAEKWLCNYIVSYALNNGLYIYITLTK